MNGYADAAIQNINSISGLEVLISTELGYIYVSKITLPN